MMSAAEVSSGSAWSATTRTIMSRNVTMPTGARLPPRSSTTITSSTNWSRISCATFAALRSRWQVTSGLLAHEVLHRDGFGEVHLVRRIRLDHREQRVLVIAGQQLAVRGEVRQHALRVVASVDGQQDLHGVLRLLMDARMVPGMRGQRL